MHQIVIDPCEQPLTDTRLIGDDHNWQFELAQGLQFFSNSKMELNLLRIPQIMLLSNDHSVPIQKNRWGLSA